VGTGERREEMKLVRIAIPAALALVAWMPSSAALQKGNKELTGSFSYQSRDFDDTSVETTDIDLVVDLGYLLTDRHEVGGRVTWFKTEVDTDFGDEDFDGNSIGAFYHFNFGMEGSMTPFVGAFYTIVGGDLGDTIDSDYGIEGGVKIYPWENGGFILKAAWDQMTGADDNPDADGLGLFAGVGLKW
jgi:hypothetical protein